MKKRIAMLLCLLFALALTGCGSAGKTGKPGGAQPAGVNDVLAQGMAEADGAKAGTADKAAGDGAPETQNGETRETQAPAPSPAPDTAPAEGTEIDVDLTALSSTMVYSEVYNMMSSPESYIGKTVKMKGLFAYYHDEATDAYYFACIIQDATACCAQGIEFVLTDDYAYPEDYPEVDEEICVVGRFDTYQEGEYTYCTLRGATLV